MSISDQINKTIFSDKKAVFLFDKEKHIKKYYKKIALTPYIFSKKQYKDIRDKSEAINKLLEKTINLYFSEKKVSNFFNLSKIQKQVVKQYYQDQNSLYISRYDSFIDEKGKIKFLEFNINFPGGIDRLDIITENQYKYCVNKQIKLINPNDIGGNFVKLVKKLSKKFDGPLVFIKSVKTEPQNIQSMQFIGKILAKYKIKSLICDWKDLKVIKNKLYFNGKDVTLLFKTALTQRIWQYDMKYAKPILDLLKKKKIFMFNLPQSYLAGAKNLFALWYEKWFQKLLTKSEIRLVQSCIPKTYTLNSRSISKSQLLKKNRWVIKPIEGIGGRAVYVGKKIDADRWKKIINSHIGDKKWIAQEFIKTSQMELVSLDIKQKMMNIERAYINISPWIIDENMAGISARYSADLVVNVAKGGGIMSVLEK